MIRAKGAAHERGKLEARRAPAPVGARMAGNGGGAASPGRAARPVILWNVLCAGAALWCADLGAALVIGLIWLIGGAALS